MVDVVGGQLAHVGGLFAAAQQVGIAQDGRHGGFQLVGKGCHKAGAAFVLAAQGVHVGLHRAGHGVEAVGQAGKLGPAAGRDPAGVVPGGQVPAGGLQPAQRPGQPPGQQRRRPHRQCQRRALHRQVLPQLAAMLGKLGGDVIAAHQVQRRVLPLQGRGQHQPGVVGAAAVKHGPGPGLHRLPLAGKGHGAGQVGPKHGAAAVQHRKTVAAAAGRLQAAGIAEHRAGNVAWLPAGAGQQLLDGIPLPQVAGGGVRGGGVQRGGKVPPDGPRPAGRQSQAEQQRHCQRQLARKGHGAPPKKSRETAGQGRASSR